MTRGLTVTRSALGFGGFAIGTGATATRANQQVFGTASNTYTIGGITWERARRRSPERSRS
jgi:hypothetical protein